MINLEKSKKIFIDFDGVVVDSNKFKEHAIEESIYKLFKKKSSNEILNTDMNNDINNVNVLHHDCPATISLKITSFIEFSGV